MATTEPDSVDRSRWRCRKCGYIYDPALHDNTPFAKLPADWRCPGCGFGKDVFVKITDASPPSGAATRRKGPEE